MKIQLIVVMTLALCADARPQFKQRRGLMHVKRQDNSRACVRAANNIGDLMEMHEMWDPTQYSEVSFEEFMSVISPIDISNASERERYVCSFEGITSVSEAVARMDEMGSIEHMISVAYAMMVPNVRLTYVYYHDYMQQHPPELIDDIRLEGMELSNQLTSDLEASGFLSFEQNEVEMFVDLKLRDVDMSSSPLDDYTPAAPSNLPLDQQCSVVANDVRKLWNNAVKQWNPRHGQYVREQIREWTGIDLGSHEQMRGLICTVLEAVVNNGPNGPYQFLMDEGIIEQVATTGYPHMIEELEMLKQQLDYMLNRPPVSYYNSYPYYGSSQPPTEVFAVVKDLLDNMEAMGLFSLA